jgi:NADPH:quinone reductase-like Zn-dependent oxidoreductase
LEGAVLGTAWLTAYRALFTKSNLQPGETLLVQGASGGMSTALIQLGRAAGFEVWATSRSTMGRELAEKVGAHCTFDSNEKLPHKVQAVVDNIGPASWEHSMESAARGGTVIITGVTTGLEVKLPLLPMLSEQITVCGSIMGTFQDMKSMIGFIIASGIKPEIGQVVPMERAQEAFRAMWEGQTHGKTVFTR